MLLFNSTDQEIVDNIYDKRLDQAFIKPNISDSFYISRKTVVSNGNVVAICLVKQIAEAILLMNRDISGLTRTRALKELVITLKEELPVIGVRECYAFTHDIRYQEILKKLGFEDNNNGKVLTMTHKV